MEELRQINWIEKGKQIGLKLSLDKNNLDLFIYIAVQKYNNDYILYINEIDFSKSLALLEANYDNNDNYKIFNNLNETSNYIEEYTPITLDKLFPLKGVKIFEPICAYP